jgi:ABC-2 type transport system ATP-binding protein
MLALETCGLRREFGENIAIEGLDFSLEAGTVCALVGPNGAGKTTLLRMLACLLEPTSGAARVFGHDIGDDPRGVHAALGYLPDFFGLYEDLTAEQCLRYFCLAYGMAAERIEPRLEEVLGLVGLSGKGPEPVPSLSRGMRQRLGMARTLLHDPALLFLDEPASGLDPTARRELQDLLKKLAAGGKTIVVSSHILSDLEDYCSHVLILDKGRMAYAGPIASARQAAKATRRFRAVFLREGEKACTWLKSQPAVSAPQRRDREVTFAFAGSDDDAAALLRALVDSGADVVSFADGSGGIEDSYLALVGRNQP